MHDFCLAPRHAVFHVGPYHLDLQAVVASGRSLLEALRWEPEIGSELLIVPLRQAEEAVVRVPMEPGYCLHGIGAGEDPSGRLVVDLLELERPIYDQYQEVPDLFRGVGPGRPVRLIVDLEHRRVVERLALDYERAPDFPVTVPRLGATAPEDAWMIGMSAAGREGRKFFDELVHCDWRRGASGPAAVWRAPRGQYLAGEPALAPHPAAAGGALVCPLFDAERGESRYLVFDALDVGAGPCAELRLEAPLPTAFHAAFAPAPPSAPPVDPI